MRIQASAEHLPFKPSSFNQAVCTEVLEHLDHPQVALRQILGVLRPGGRLYGSVPSRSPIWRIRKLLSITHPHSEPFHRNYSRKQVREMLKPWANVRVRLANLGLTVAFTADN